MCKHCGRDLPGGAVAIVTAKKPRLVKHLLQRPGATSRRVVVNGPPLRVEDRSRRDELRLDLASVEKSLNKEQENERGNETRKNAHPHCRSVAAPERLRGLLNRRGHQQPRR